MNRNKYVCRYRSWTVIGCISVTCHLYIYLCICMYINHLHRLFRNLFDRMMLKNWKKCAVCSKRTQFSKSIFRASFFSSPSQQKTSKTAIFSLFSIRHQMTLTNWYIYYNNDFWWFLMISLISVDFLDFCWFLVISCDFLDFSWFPWFLVISLISRDFFDFNLISSTGNQFVPPCQK